MHKKYVSTILVVSFVMVFHVIMLLIVIIFIKRFYRN